MAQPLLGPVFMSYSRRDEIVMGRIANFLRNQGIEVWVDNEKLIPGTPIWEEEIEKAIKATAAIVVVMSPDAKNSEWVRREISLADHYRKRVFPVLVRGDQDSSITLRLITRQFVDLRESQEIGLKRLSMALSPYLEMLQAEQRAQEEKELLARQQAEEQRMARKKARQDRLARERLAKQKAEEEQLAAEKAEAERKAKHETEQMLAQQTAQAGPITTSEAEEERRAPEKVKAAPKVRKGADQFVAQKTEERVTKDKIEAERPARGKRLATNKAAPVPEKTIRPQYFPQQRAILKWSMLAIIGIAIVAIGASGIPYLAGLINSPATEAPVEPTQPLEPTPTEAMEVTETAEATEPAAVETREPTMIPTLVPPLGDVSFFSTQFNIVEEGEKFRAILQEGGNYDFTGSEEGPLIDLVLAGAETGQGQVDLVGSVHGTYPFIGDAMMNMMDVVDNLSADREFNQAYLETGLLGTEDYLYYAPWMQATYIMAAHTVALEFLPAGADFNALTWEQFVEWCQTMLEETGGPKCGLPHAGLFHRYLEGFLWPSFTGGMVTRFKSQEAAEMLVWARDSLWPAIHPQSISYEFMQEPLQSGEVWVAFDHVARLIEAFNADPTNLVALPAPAGPAGRGYMAIIVGLGIPNDAPNPEGALALIDYLTRPETQKRMLSELGFFPVVGGVDTSDLPEGLALEAAAVDATVNAPDAIPALIPVGLGSRGGEINDIFRAAFDRVVIDGEDPARVLEEEAANLQAILDDTGAACWAPDPPSDGPCQVE